MKIRDRIKELRRVKASELAPNPKNWRTHPQAQQDALRGLLAEVGYADALLARELPDGGLMLIDGHLRAETTPDMEVPVLILDLTEEEADKVLATLDPLAAMAEANKQALGELLASIESESEGVEKMLAELATGEGIDLFEEAETPDPEPQIDRADELQKKWKVEPGQLWEIPGKAGTHRVLCGDCRDAADIARLCVEKVNGCFTSPPYAEQRKYDETSGFKPIKPDEYVEWWEAVQAGVRSVLADDGSFFVNIKPHCEDGERVLYVFDLVLAMKKRWGWRFSEEFCWKSSGVPKVPARRFKNQFEPVYHFAVGEYKFKPDQATHESDRAFRAAGKGRASNLQGQEDWSKGIDVKQGEAYPGNVVAANYDSHGGKGVGHSAAFPVGLPSFFIKAFSDPGDRWLDPFLGSGTTLIAAEQLGRVCYGAELAPKYVAVILQRAKDAGLKPNLSARQPAEIAAG